MALTVSSNEARSNLGNLLKTTSEEEVVIAVRNKPTAVLISYADYEEFQRLQKMQKRLAGLQKMRELKARTQQGIQEIPQATLYREAGMTDEDAIAELLALDEPTHLAESE